MAGGINSVNSFKDFKIDARGALLLLRIRSKQDDVIMRGVADEIEKEGISFLSCTKFLQSELAPNYVLTKRKPSASELDDIEIGKNVIASISEENIGQLVVVKDSVVVAVEAIEGSDKTILRGGDLAGKGTVVVKFSKPNQDMRFDVPTIGLQTIDTMIKSRASVLAIESERTIILDKERVVEKANKNKITIIGCQPLVKHTPKH